MKTGKGFIFRILPALVLAVLIQSVFVSAADATADVSLTDSASTPYTYTLGDGTEAYDFGSVPAGVGASASVIFYINNDGPSDSLSIAANAVAVSVGSPEFAVTSQPSTAGSPYAVGTSVASFTITFTPSSATGFPGVVNLTTTNGTTSPFTVGLFGTGIATPPDPTVATILPTSGTTAGGDTVTITGTNFFSGFTTVTIGVTACTAVTVAAGGLSLTCTTPTGTVGPPAVDVVVENTGAVAPTATLTGGFTYTNVAPTATVAAFSGTIKEGVLLTSGAYTYADADSDAEGSSTFQWYTGTSNTCAGKAVISGETGTIATGGTKTYTPVAGDVGKYIYASVLHPKLLPARLRVRNL